MNNLLIKLLAHPVQRGMRCDCCRHWTQDPVWTSEGDCAEHSDDLTLSHMGCVYWQGRADCGLDYMGVPLESSAAHHEEK